METSFALPQLPTLVKGWADRIAAGEFYGADLDPDVVAVVNDMRTFVAAFNGIVASDNVAGVNDYVMVKVQNCRAYPNSHPPHTYLDHGSWFACWGEAHV